MDTKTSGCAVAEFERTSPCQPADQQRPAAERAPSNWLLVVESSGDRRLDEELRANYWAITHAAASSNDIATPLAHSTSNRRSPSD